jgi:hypothetical protein
MPAKECNAAHHHESEGASATFPAQEWSPSLTGRSNLCEMLLKYFTPHTHTSVLGIKLLPEFSFVHHIYVCASNITYVQVETQRPKICFFDTLPESYL